jgi:hypothetical protein
MNTKTISFNQPLNGEKAIQTPFDLIFKNSKVYISYCKKGLLSSDPTESELPDILGTIPDIIQNRLLPVMAQNDIVQTPPYITGVLSVVLSELSPYINQLESQIACLTKANTNLVHKVSSKSNLITQLTIQIQEMEKEHELMQHELERTIMKLDEMSVYTSYPSHVTPKSGEGREDGKLKKRSSSQSQKDYTDHDEPCEKSKPNDSYNVPDLFAQQYWENTDTFKSFIEKETQYTYYKRMGSCENILKIVNLNSSPFGVFSEKLICELLDIGPRSSSQNDGIRNGKKIEIKSARYWGSNNDCKWQHLEPNHDYEYVLFAILGFDRFNVWGIPKSLLMGQLIEKKIVRDQGKQGYWVKMSKVMPYLTKIDNIVDLDRLLG